MSVPGGAGRAILLLVLLMTVSSCALTETLTGALAKKKTGPEVYYTVPPVTYIREFPGYASQHVGTVYHGEQVTILSKMEDEDWCRVQTSGGQEGWIQRALLSPVPLRVETYYVQEAEVPLRPEPQKEVISRQVLHPGEEVIKLADNEQGWWRVLVEKDKSLGWLPAESLAATPPKKTVPDLAKKPSGKDQAETAPSELAPNQFFVAVNSLELHLLPLFSSKVVKVLQLNDKVEEVYRSGSKWRKVKYPETGVQGWTLASYLSKSATKAPKRAVRKRKKAPTRTKRRAPAKKPLRPPEDLEPEIM